MIIISRVNKNDANIYFWLILNSYLSKWYVVALRIIWKIKFDRSTKYIRIPAHLQAIDQSENLTKTPKQPCQLDKCRCSEILPDFFEIRHAATVTPEKRCVPNLALRVPGRRTQKSTVFPCFDPRHGAPENTPVFQTAGNWNPAAVHLATRRTRGRRWCRCRRRRAQQPQVGARTEESAQVN